MEEVIGSNPICSTRLIFTKKTGTPVFFITYAIILGYLPLAKPMLTVLPIKSTLVPA
jgi:hypothetical protein